MCVSILNKKGGAYVSWPLKFLEILQKGISCHPETKSIIWWDKQLNIYSCFRRHAEVSKRITLVFLIGHHKPIRARFITSCEESLSLLGHFINCIALVFLTPVDKISLWKVDTDTFNFSTFGWYTQRRLRLDATNRGSQHNYSMHTLLGWPCVIDGDPNGACAAIWLLSCKIASKSLPLL